MLGSITLKKAIRIKAMTIQSVAVYAQHFSTMPVMMKTRRITPATMLNIVQYVSDWSGVTGRKMPTNNPATSIIISVFPIHELRNSGRRIAFIAYIDSE